MRTTFEYLAPEDSKELHKVLDEYGEKAELLAGGTDLLVDIRNDVKAPEAVVDFKKIEKFNGINYDSVEGLSIGATVTCSELINNKKVQEDFSFLIEAAEELASPQIRNRATIVGNLCNASPCADMARALLCLDTTVEISSADGTRSVPLTDFFSGVKETVLEANEIVERLVIPAEMEDAIGGNRKLKRIKGHDLSLASVTMVKIDDRIKVAIGSCGTTPVLLPELPADNAAEKICEEADSLISPIDDVRASAEYREFIVKKYIKELTEELN